MKNSMQGFTLALAWSRCLGLKNRYELSSRPSKAMQAVTATGKSGLNSDQAARRNPQSKAAKERSTLVATNCPSQWSTHGAFISCYSPNEQQEKQSS